MLGSNRHPGSDWGLLPQFLLAGPDGEVARLSRQLQMLLQLQLRIAQQLEGQVQAVSHLALVLGGLCAQAEHPVFNAPQSVKWSRNAHDCGVHPRAPGTPSQPSGKGTRARRMAQTAARLLDHVIPRVPVRQWVQVCQARLPIPLRLLLAAQRKLVTP